MSKTDRIEIRCDPDWKTGIMNRAVGKGMSVAKYLRAAIALGETVLDGTFQFDEALEETTGGEIIMGEILEGCGYYGNTVHMDPDKVERYKADLIQITKNCNTLYKAQLISDTVDIENQIINNIIKED